MELTVTEYQEKAMTTCLPSSKNLAYMLHNLIGEVGELCEKICEFADDENPHLTFFAQFAHMAKGHGKIGKEIRKNPDTSTYYKHAVKLDEIVSRFTPEQMTEISKEVGDCHWQLNGVGSVLGLKSNDVCQQNLNKLVSRQQRDKIDGDGDNR